MTRNTRLTGEVRLRSTWTGKLILQVEEKRSHFDHQLGDSSILTYWRDAVAADLLIRLPIKLQNKEA